MASKAAGRAIERVCRAAPEAGHFSVLTVCDRRGIEQTISNTVRRGRDTIVAHW
jgi:predicted dienelactone hydrolase